MRSSAVDHDFGDQRVVQKPLQRPEAQDFVDDFPDQASPFFRRQGDLLVIDEGAKGLPNHAPHVAFVEAAISDAIAQAGCQFFGRALLDSRQGVRGVGLGCFGQGSQKMVAGGFGGRENGNMGGAGRMVWPGGALRGNPGGFKSVNETHGYSPLRCGCLLAGDGEFARKAQRGFSALSGQDPDGCPGAAVRRHSLKTAMCGTTAG